MKRLHLLPCWSEVFVSLRPKRPFWAVSCVPSVQILWPTMRCGAQVPLLWKPGNGLHSAGFFGGFFHPPLNNHQVVCDSVLILPLQLCLTFTWKDAFDKGSLFGGSVKLGKRLTRMTIHLRCALNRSQDMAKQVEQNGLLCYIWAQGCVCVLYPWNFKMLINAYIKKQS